MGVSGNSVPHCTQWFCWSLSLWKMAISLGILTQHFQLPTHIVQASHSIGRIFWVADPCEQIPKLETGWAWTLAILLASVAGGNLTPVRGLHFSATATHGMGRKSVETCDPRISEMPFESFEPGLKTHLVVGAQKRGYTCISCRILLGTHQVWSLRPRGSDLCGHLSSGDLSDLSCHVDILDGSLEMIKWMACLVAHVSLLH